MVSFISVWRVRWLALVFLIFSPLLSMASTPTVVVLGDSISAAYGIEEEDGWVSILRQRLSERETPYAVVNASVSGDTTSGGLARLRSAFTRLQPDILVIELGGNDGLRGLSLKNLRKNLSAMVTLCADAGCKPVLLGMRIPENYGKAYTQRFHKSFARVAEELTVPLMPFFLEGVALDDSLMQDDGIHPNAEAQQVLFENAWPLIEPLLE